MGICVYSDLLEGVTCRAGVDAVLEAPGRSTEPDLEPGGIMARWLCKKVLLVRRPLTDERLPS